MVIESTTKKPLTQNQSEILKFIKETCEKNGSPPSYREIQSHFGYKAVGTVQDHVKALIQKGALEKTFTQNQKRARSLMPTEKPMGVKRIPIYGEIAAGGPRDAAQLELGYIAISEEITKEECFALRVVGTSMIDVGIFEGDHLIVEKTQRIKTGDIVVALLDGETTVKRYYQKAGKTQLVPENSKMSPIQITTQDLQIQGKVIGLQRRF